MNAKIKDAFSSLSQEQQTLVLAFYANALTVDAREGYEAGTDRLSDPALVRRINEVQHRVTDAIVKRLIDSNARYPDDVLIDIVAGDLRSACSFRRAWRTALGRDLPE